MQTTIQIGVLTLIIDTRQWSDREFFDAFSYGLQCYCECDSDQRQVTVSHLVEMMKEVVTDNDGLGQKFSREWFYGFTLGWMTGLNNPEIINDDPNLSYTESLIRKHIPLYRDLVLQGSEPTAQEKERASGTEPIPVVEVQEA
jgi:hypothetical protein